MNINRLLIFALFIFVISVGFAYLTKQIFDTRLIDIRNDIDLINGNLNSLVSLQRDLNANVLDKYSLKKFDEYSSKVLAEEIKLELLRLSRREIDIEQFEINLRNFRLNIIANIDRLNER